MVDLDPNYLLTLEGRLFRPVTLEDAPLLLEAGLESKGPGFSEWMPWCHQHYSMEDSQAFLAGRPQEWRDGTDYTLGIFDSSQTRLLGVTGINQINRLHNFANLGYWVRRSMWGQGIAGLAIEASRRLALEAAGLRRVEILVAAGNHKSIRAAEKSGAVREGTLRQRLLIEGQYHDAVMFSLVQAE